MKREGYIYVTTDFKRNNVWYIPRTRLIQNNRGKENILFHEITEEQFKRIQSGEDLDMYEEIGMMDLSAPVPSEGEGEEEDLKAKQTRVINKRKSALRG